MEATIIDKKKSKLIVEADVVNRLDDSTSDVFCNELICAKLEGKKQTATEPSEGSNNISENLAQDLTEAQGEVQVFVEENVKKYSYVSQVDLQKREDPNIQHVVQTPQLLTVPTFIKVPVQKIKEPEIQKEVESTFNAELQLLPRAQKVGISRPRPAPTLPVATKPLFAQIFPNAEPLPEERIFPGGQKLQIARTRPVAPKLPGAKKPPLAEIFAKAESLPELLTFPGGQKVRIARTTVAPMLPRTKKLPKTQVLPELRVTNKNLAAKVSTPSNLAKLNLETQRAKLSNQSSMKLNTPSKNDSSFKKNKLIHESSDESDSENKDSEYWKKKFKQKSRQDGNIGVQKTPQTHQSSMRLKTPTKNRSGFNKNKRIDESESKNKDSGYLKKNYKQISRQDGNIGLLKPFLLPPTHQSSRMNTPSKNRSNFKKNKRIDESESVTDSENTKKKSKRQREETCAALQTTPQVIKLNVSFKSNSKTKIDSIVANNGNLTTEPILAHSTVSRDLQCSVKLKRLKPEEIKSYRQSSIRGATPSTAHNVDGNESKSSSSYGCKPTLQCSVQLKHLKPEKIKSYRQSSIPGATPSKAHNVDGNEPKRSSSYGCKQCSVKLKRLKPEEIKSYRQSYIRGATPSKALKVDGNESKSLSFHGCKQVSVKLERLKLEELKSYRQSSIRKGNLSKALKVNGNESKSSSCYGCEPTLQCSVKLKRLKPEEINSYRQ